MNVDMTRSLAFTFRTTDGGTAIAVQKRRYGSESFSDGLETEYQFRIGRETWGDNNARSDNKVDIKVDNNVWNDTVKHPQTRTRTTIPYNIRTKSGGVFWMKTWLEKAVIYRSDAGRTESNLRNG